MCGAEKVRHMLMGEQVLKKWKKSKKMTVAFGGILVMSVVIGGCGGREDAKKSIKIGISVYDQYDTFVSEMMKDFNDYATKKEEETGVAINIDTYNASASQSTQNSQVENMITEGCDVICVNLVDRTDPTAIIDLAEKNNIPVIFFNRELVEEDLERWTRLYYVGAQAFESGIMQGELAAEAFLTDQSLDKNGDGIFQYVVLEGEAGHQDAIVRTEYSVSTMIDSGVEVEKLGYAIANWNRAQAQTKMAQLMSQFGDSIELVIANNDDMALGAIDALKASDLTKDEWPAVIGIDGTDVGLEAVKNKEMIGTVYNDKEGQADAMLNLAYELSTGGDLSDLNLIDGKYIRLPYARVTCDDVEDVCGYILEEEWKNFAYTYLASCTGSRAYCSTLFGIVPIKDAAVAEKIAQDIDLVTKDYPAAFGLEEAVRPFRSIMVDAFCQYIPNGESVWKSMHE